MGSDFTVFPFSGDQGGRGGSTLAQWAADPANTAWMESEYPALVLASLLGQLGSFNSPRLGTVS